MPWPESRRNRSQVLSARVWIGGSSVIGRSGVVEGVRCDVLSRGRAAGLAGDGGGLTRCVFVRAAGRGRRKRSNKRTVLAPSVGVCVICGAVL